MPTDHDKTIVNAMTVDVEDYFQVSAFEPYIHRSSWDEMPCRAPANVDRILQLMADSGVRATFFILGWLAKRHPGMVRRIADQGHEIASHGYGHQRAQSLSPQAFTEDILRSRLLLEDATGMQVVGYRAPSFSIGRSNLWCHARLEMAGYRYSSSVYPIAHDHYGMPEAPRFMYLAADSLVEIPATTVRWGARNVPCSGGGYFRLMPYVCSRWMIQRVNGLDGEPAVFYFHPWEVDPAQPRPHGLDVRTRFRHYVNLERNEAKLRRLMSDFRWGRMDDVFLRQRQPALQRQDVGGRIQVRRDGRQDADCVTF